MKKTTVAVTCPVATFRFRGVFRVVTMAMAAVFGTTAFAQQAAPTTCNPNDSMTPAQMQACASQQPAATPAAGPTPLAPATTVVVTPQQAAKPATMQPDRAADADAVGKPYAPPQVPLVDPHGNIQSLEDINTQVPLKTGTPKRFGSESFLRGTGNTDDLPSDLPAGPDYVLGPGDQVIINMWGGHSERLNTVIDRQGQVTLPEAGTVNVNGLTIGAAQAVIQKALSAQYQSEHVEISLGRVRTVRVYIVGDVQRPGAYDVSSLSTPLSVLYAAGGPTAIGSLRVLKQYRGDRLVAQIDLYDFLLRGVRSLVEHLQPGDTILIPPVGPQVTVEGMVRRPAIYELNGETSLAQVLDLAGGLLPEADLRQVTVARIEANKGRSMVQVDLPAATVERSQTLRSFSVRGGDDVIVPQILPYNQEMVFLTGHVYRSGRYAYREGMTLIDLLKSYQDILPEPSDHGEIVRLLPPDFRPETITFNLADVMAGNAVVPLQRYDVVRIFGRYTVDAPKVTIAGQVLRPGEFPLEKGMTVSALILMAGGFTRAAYLDTGELVSYAVVNGQQVVVNRAPFDISRVMAGDKQEDKLLKPGDVVSIRAIAGWTDIGAAVTITGEVQHPGSYGLQEGEHLSSVLKRAGGYRNEAYPPAAVLERIQVQQLNQQSRDLMIQRLQDAPVTASVNLVNPQPGDLTQQALELQRSRAIAALRDRPVTGRLVVNIPGPISKWEGTAADIPLRAGDTLNIPKLPDFVVIAGEVYNPTAISFVPGKRAKDYLLRAGGTTSSADTKRIYILRADGSVVAHGNGWGSSKLMNTRMHPGDTIFVPEKIIGGSLTFRNALAAAQIAVQGSLVAAAAGVL